MDPDFEGAAPPVPTPWRRMLLASLLLHALLLRWPGLRPAQPDDARWSGLEVRLAPPMHPSSRPNLETPAVPAASAPRRARPTLPSVPAPAALGPAERAMLAPPAEPAKPLLPAAPPRSPPPPATPADRAPRSASDAESEASVNAPSKGGGEAAAGTAETARRAVIRDTVRELEAAARAAQREGRAALRTPGALEALLRDRLARPEAYREIALDHGETMIQMPGGGCMLTSGPPNGVHPFATPLVTFTTPEMDARCPR